MVLDDSGTVHETWTAKCSLVKSKNVSADKSSRLDFCVKQ